MVSESPSITATIEAAAGDEANAIAAGESSAAEETSKRRAVSITGRGSNVSFIIDEDAPIDEAASELAKQLSKREGALFSQGGVSVNTGARTLTLRERAAIRKVFEENSGLRVARFISTIGDHVIESEELPEEALGLHPWRLAPVRTPDSGKAQDSVFSSLTRDTRHSHTQAMMIRSTFRSGESVHHYGDVVVLGDTNPGSEIKADGDIVVMGALKGLAHAGASGDDKAAIIALEIASPRIRIGHCEAVISATGKTRKGKRGGRDAETGQTTIAYMREGAIYVSPFAGRFARYTKGVLYDG